MYRKILIGGVTAAAIVGAGGTALALTGSDTTAGSAVTSAVTSSSGAGAASAQLGLGKGGRRLLRRLAHAQIVTRTKSGFVTHDLIVGTVTSVSATSITVEAADHTSETFVVTGATKVRVRSNGTGAPGTIGQVADGDLVLVAGTGSTTFTAKHILDVKK